MTERQPSLVLQDYVHSSVNIESDKPGEKRAIWRDMRLLYGARLRLMADVLGLLEAHPRLADGRQAEVNGLFIANRLTMRFGHLRQPEQAAAWAALRMYEDKRGAPSDQPLFVTK